MLNIDQSNRAGLDCYEKQGTTADVFSTRVCPATTLLGAVGPCKLRFLLAHRPLLSSPPLAGTLNKLPGYFLGGCDRTLCSLCGGNVPLSLPYNHPLCPFVAREWVDTEATQRSAPTINIKLTILNYLCPRSPTWCPSLSAPALRHVPLSLPRRRSIPTPPSHPRLAALITQTHLGFRVAVHALMVRRKVGCRV